jgi:hypothetical protein
VGEAIKGSLLLAEVLSAEGFATKPAPRAPRYDIIQAIRLDSRERLLAFCQAVQTMCPVGAYIRPTAGATAGAFHPFFGVFISWCLQQQVRSESLSGGLSPGFYNGMCVF